MEDGVRQGFVISRLLASVSKFWTDHIS